MQLGQSWAWFNMALIPLWNHDLRTVRRMWRSCLSKSSSTVCIWDSRGPENSTLSPWSWKLCMDSNEWYSSQCKESETIA